MHTLVYGTNEYEVLNLEEKSFINECSETSHIYVNGRFLPNMLGINKTIQDIILNATKIIIIY